MSRLVQIELALYEQESHNEATIIPNSLYNMLLLRPFDNRVSIIIDTFGYTNDRRMCVWYKKFERILCDLGLQRS